MEVKIEMKNKLLTLVIPVLTVFLFTGISSATPLEDITHHISNDAETSLNISNADDMILITNAGSARYSNTTTEDAIQTVMETVPIKYSKIFQMNQPDHDPTFTFAVKNSKGYYARKYTVLQSGEVLKTPVVYIGLDMTENQFQQAKANLGYDVLSLLSAWNAGAPSDLLKVAAWTGNVSPGLIGAYSASKQFMANYPLTSNATSYHVIVSTGGGDDDVPMFFMDSTPLKWVTVGSDTFYNFKSAYTDDSHENIYIRWDSLSRTGVMFYWTLSDMTYNGGETLQGLIKNAQCIGMLATNPSALYKVLKATNIDYQTFKTLWDTGIDSEYISSIPVTPIEWISTVSVIPREEYSAMYASGINAVMVANRALQAAGFEPLDSDDLLITSAGYSETQGISAGAIDGIISATGIKFKNIYSLKRGTQTPLWYVFVKKPDETTGPLHAVFVDGNGAIRPVTYGGTQFNVFDISAVNLAGATGTEGYQKSLAVASTYGYSIPQYAQQDYYIVSLANQWAYAMPYEFALAATGGGCPGSGLAQGYVLANIIRSWLPLSDGQYYAYIGVPAHCKEQVLMEVLGLSAARGNYFTTGTRTASDASAVGIAIRWDPVKNTGKAILVSYNKDAVNAIQPASNSYYKTMYWALWYITQAFPGKELYGTVTSAYSIAKSVTLTSGEFRSLIAASDPVSYIKDFEDVTAPSLNVRVDDSTLYMDINEEGTIFYSFDGRTWNVYSAPVKLGKHVKTVYYYAVDLAGNAHQVGSISVPENQAQNTPEVSYGSVTAGKASVISWIMKRIRSDDSSAVVEEVTGQGTSSPVNPAEHPGSASSSWFIPVYAAIILAVGGLGMYLFRRRASRSNEATWQPGK